MSAKAILNTAVDAIITIDERGIVENANPAVERLFGYPPAELIGRDVSVLMPSPHREQHDEYLARYLRTGEARVMGTGRELEGLRRDGTPRRDHGRASQPSTRGVSCTTEHFQP